MAGAGLGTALVPLLAVDTSDPAICVIPTGLDPRRIAILWHRDRYRSPASEAFVEIALRGLPRARCGPGGARPDARLSVPGTIGEGERGRPAGILPAVPDNPVAAGRTMPQTPQQAHRRGRRRHRRRGPDDGPGAPREAVPVHGAAAARVRAVRRADRRRGGRDPHHRAGDAGGVRGRRHRAVLRGRRHLQGARPGGREARRRGHRQLQRLADGPVRPARRVAGQPRRPRVARGHHREPQLLDHAARAAADGAPRHGGHRAGRRRHLPVRRRHRPQGHRGARGPDQGPRGGPAEGRLRLPAPDRVQRPAPHRRVPRQRVHEGGVEGRHREPQDPAPAGPAPVVHGRPRAGLREPLRGRPRRDPAPITPARPARCSRA